MLERRKLGEREEVRCSACHMVVGLSWIRRRRCAAKGGRFYEAGGRVGPPEENERFSGANAKVDCQILEGSAEESIVQHADKIGADLIVVGSHKPGMRHIFLGSTATRIVQHAECSVHVLR